MIWKVGNASTSGATALDTSYQAEYFKTINTGTSTAYYTYNIRKMFILNMLINRPLRSHFGGLVAVLPDTGDSI